jgi:hypothetical protein
MMAISHLQLINGLGGYAMDQDLMQSFESVVKTFEPGDVLLDTDAFFLDILCGTKPGKHR